MIVTRNLLKFAHLFGVRGGVWGGLGLDYGCFRGWGPDLFYIFIILLLIAKYFHIFEVI